MPKVVLTGNVLPDTVKINVVGLGTVNWTGPDAGLDMKFEVEIQNSLVRVECETNRFNPPDDVVPIYIRALDLTRCAVDLVGFSEGRGLTVNLDAIIDDKGKKTFVEPKQPALARYVSAIGPGRNFQEVWKLSVEQPSIFQAVNDLVATIALPHHGPVNAARAVEGLSHLVGGVGADSKARWKALRDALNLDRAFIQEITYLPTNPRHGNRTHIPGPKVTLVVVRAWMIMNRFLEFKLRGDVPLPLAEFPLLKG